MYVYVCVPACVYSSSAKQIYMVPLALKTEKFYVNSYLFEAVLSLTSPTEKFL